MAESVDPEFELIDADTLLERDTDEPDKGLSTPRRPFPPRMWLRGVLASIAGLDASDWGALAIAAASLAAVGLTAVTANTLVAAWLACALLMFWGLVAVGVIRLPG